MPDLSPAQNLHCVRREEYLIHVSRIFLFLGFLLCGKYLPDRDGSILLSIFSSPSEIWRTFFKMVQDQSLFTHIGYHADGNSGQLCLSFSRDRHGGSSMVLSKAFTDPGAYLVVLNSLPIPALAPLLIVWLGANIRTIIVAGMSVAIFGSVINLYTGFREADPPEKLKLIRTLGGTKRRTDKDCPSVFRASS